MQRRAPSFRPLLLWLLLPWPGAGQFQVKGPSSPVIARVGEAAVLPCHLSPPTDAQNMVVRWYRDRQSVLVHEYRDSLDHMEQQSLQYQGRTELLRENITQGQVALRIHPVLPGDEGQYSCVFLRSAQLSRAQFELLVAASGAPPHIHIQPAHTGSIKMTCSSSGWYPHPELQWRDTQGRPLSPDSVKMSIREDGLMHVDSSITVEESSRADVSCSIRNPVLREEKESRLSVAEALFPRVSAWTVALAVLLVLLTFSLMITGVFLQRFRRALDGIAKELEQRKLVIKKCLKEAQRFAEDIILDEVTAHPQLLVLDRGKRVECLPTARALPANRRRFTVLRAVLGRNSFFTGHHYWEVDVGGSETWTVGLCSDSINRETHFKDVHPENGFWSINRTHDNYRALSLPRYNFKVAAPLSVVGILLQCEGSISFYDVKQLTLLHTFTGKFSLPLRPCFMPGLPSLGHYPSLVISPVPTPDESGPP
ncbi:PREDICTED: butyrophilin subfamily 1 member A1-like [Chinchilla lanigera]|uniref:butyrophilin subfamily 1 member A1-like n=1 Tax=Chinchilla lanigera TaxID=34839 RepID=UPI000698B1C1|nr:PREDICTED: butyrophilin subfamily 1 member A1-like [Chinchilla lanigera]